MLAVHVVRAPSSLVVVMTLVAVVPGLRDVAVSESTIEVELTSLSPISVPDGEEMLVLFPPETPGAEPGALLPSGDTSVEEDARSEAGTVIVVVGPPGCVEVRVRIEVDATLEPVPYPEAAVPDPEGAREVPFPPGTG